MSKKFFTRSLTAILSSVMTLEFGVFNMPQDVFAIDNTTSYAVYSDGDIIVNTEKGVFNGNVYSGDDFRYLGSDLCYVNKTLNADSVSDKVQVLNKEDSRVSKPDYRELLSSRVRYSDQRSGNVSLDGGVYDLSGSFRTDGGLTVNRTVFSGKGYVTAAKNIKYNALQNEEGTELFLTSTEENITIMGSDLVMTGVIYAPKGKVEINAKNFTFNGTIVANEIELNGTNLTVNELSEEENTLLLFNPEIKISGASETHKQNRKVTLDISESFGLSDIDESSLAWDFVPEDPGSFSAVKIDETASTPLHRELIVSKPGEYNIRITGKDTDGVPFVHKEKLTITEDIAPVADFWKGFEVTGRDSDGKAKITLEDTSYSPDGDEIGSRVWSVQFDSDNDGDFSDEKEEIFSVGNETKVTYDAESVGKYKFDLHVTEIFDDTIKSLLSDDAYLVSDTSGKENKDSVIEITNDAPRSHSGISKAKNVDIVITAGNTDIDDINTLNRNIEDVKKTLESKGFSVNLTTLSTSTLTAKDTFAWKEYDHYNYKDSYLPTLDKHIIYDDNSIKMLGYSVSPLRDWLFVDDGISAKRVLSFDMVRDRTDWHSMEGGGFLFNTSIKKDEPKTDENGNEIEAREKMSGYCIILTSGGFRLIQLTDVDVENFRNGGISGAVQSVGKVLTGVRVPDVYADYNVKIVANRHVVSVYINDEKLIDNFVLPDSDTGTGFGPIICHASHACSQQSYFTFSNIRMSTVHGSELSDVLDNHEWRKSSERFVLNLSQESLYDLNDDASVGHAVKSLIENNAHFVGIGTVESKDEYQSILDSTDGTYMDWYDLIKDNDLTKKYFLNALGEKDYSVDDMITTSDEIVYDNYYDDSENDPIGEQNWTYDLDASVYENSKGTTGVSQSAEPLTYLEATGLYKITSLLRDDPTNNNKYLDSYKKWSNEVQWTDGLYVHSKPVAEVSSEIFKTDNANKYVCELSFNAYDTDALSKADKGIKEELKEWKRISDKEWIKGTVPKTIDAGEVYLQKYAVRDEQGAWSDTAVEIIYGEKNENTDVFKDDKPPVVKLTLSDENPCLGDTILVTVTATDDTEIATVKTSMNGNVLSNYQGSFVYECKNVGEFVFTSVAEDIGHNTSTAEVKLVVEDRRDLICPEIKIDTKTGIAAEDGKVTVKGSITDNVKLDNYFAELKAPDETEYTKIYTSDEEVSEDTVVTFDTDGKAGKYSLRITAVDTAGNASYSNIDITVSEDESCKSSQRVSNEKAKPEQWTNTPADISITASKDVAEVGEVVTLTIDAEDKDGLTAVKIFKDNRQVAEGTGQIRFTETEPKTVVIKVETTDRFGRHDTATKEISFADSADRTLPIAEITSPEASSEVSGKVSIKGSAYDEEGLRGYKLEYKQQNTSAYKLITSSLNERKDAELGVWDTYALDNGVYDIKLTVTDNGGNITECTGQYTVKNGKEAPAEQVNEELIVFSKPESSVTADGVIKIEAKADSSLNGRDYEVTVRRADGNGAQKEVKSGKLDGNGNVSASVDTSMFDEGDYIVTVSVKVPDGDSVKKDTRVTVKHDYEKADEDVVCTIVSPKHNDEITAPAEIKADVSENTFIRYKFEYAPAGTEDFILFEKGSVSGSEIIGKLDPTLMENGFYDIRLTAYGDGIKAEDTVTVEVSGNMKIGNFTISFADLDFKAGEVPVTMIRTYDSRRKDIKGEFGYGWDLSFENVKLYINSDQSDFWEEARSSSFFVTKYIIQETKQHKIKIDLGNGISEEFVMQLSPAQQVLIPQHYGLTMTYVPTNGSGSTLVPCDMSPSELFYDSGRLFNSEFEDYDPQRFVYTRPDGTQYVIDAKQGLMSVTTTTGETISFGKNGVTSSDGKSISFLYDEEGRIAEASDSTGKKLTYEYDVFGDLVCVTDQTGSTTKFTYKKHYLSEIYDARGVMISRNEYDNEGRLTKSVDANGNEIAYEHDIDGREEVVTDRNGGVTRYIYDEKGNILSQTDANGNTVKNTYDSNGNLASKTDALGNTTNYKYDTMGNMLTLTDAEGHTITNEYNSKGLLTSINSTGIDALKIRYTDDGLTSGTTDAMGNEINYEYDSNKRLKSVTDEIGTYMNMTYDSKGNVKSVTNGAGAVAEFSYDAEGNCISKTLYYTSDGASKSVTENYVYDDKGHLIKTIDSEGNIVSNEYNSIDKISVATDEKGRQTSYDYDNLGNLTKIRYSDGTTELFTYDKEGNNLSATDRLGRKVTMEYDKVGNLISKTYPNGKAVTYEYDANYNLVSSTDTRGAVTKYEYDKIGNNTAIIDALGNKTSFAYNEHGLLGSMTDAKGNKFTYSYDDNGNRTKTAYPDGSSVSTEYDARGRVTSQTDQNGYVTSYKYDGADNLTGVTDAAGKTTSYEYDERNYLVKVIDANGNATSYTYDDHGRVVATTNAMGKTATATYDICGNILTSTDYAGKLTEFTYDNLDRLTRRKNDDGTVSFSYTRDGKVSSVSAKEGTTQYSYNNMDGLTKVSYPGGKYIEYNYDENEVLTSINTNFGSTSYDYDLLGRLTRVVDRNGFVTQYEYDANGNRTAVKYANGIEVTYSYDEVNRLVSEKVIDSNGETVAQYDYTLGAAGERTKVAELDRTVEYTYDELYRLTGEKITSSDGKVTEYTYTYDAVSNRISKTENGKETVYSYNALNQLVQENNTVYTYDDAGNLISTDSGVKSSTYVYNASNKLLRATVMAGDEVAAEEYTYSYDGARLSKKTIKGEETIEVKYFNDDEDLTNVLAETDKNGNALCWYTIGDDLISMERDGQTYIYLYDGHGTVRGLINADGELTDTYNYDAFGNMLERTGDTENSYLYCGEQQDGTTGLYYLRARYMNPETGTFTSMDTYQGSIFEPDTIHKYLYANSNPVTYDDPSGNMARVAIFAGMTAQQIAYDACIILIGFALLAQLAKIGAQATTRYNYQYSLLDLICDGISNTVNLAAKVMTMVTTAVVTQSMVLYNQMALAHKALADKLSDTKAKLPKFKAKVYQVAYLSSFGALIRMPGKLTFSEALIALGVTGAANVTLNSRFTYDKGRSSEAQREAQRQPNIDDSKDWGVYTHSQAYAKALAVVLGWNENPDSMHGLPEAHGHGRLGYYGHYHDFTHSMHIWYGGQL